MGPACPFVNKCPKAPCPLPGAASLALLPGLSPTCKVLPTYLPDSTVYVLAKEKLGV